MLFRSRPSLIIGSVPFHAEAVQRQELCGNLQYALYGFGMERNRANDQGRPQLRNRVEGFDMPAIAQERQLAEIRAIACQIRQHIRTPAGDTDELAARSDRAQNRGNIGSE